MCYPKQKCCEIILCINHKDEKGYFTTGGYIDENESGIDTLDSFIRVFIRGRSTYILPTRGKLSDNKRQGAFAERTLFD